jgi:hypothetical protein
VRKTFKNVGLAVFYVYSLVFALFATPYFNWRYAREHGFGSWLVFGEVIATGKAMIWPYYALAGIGSGGSSAGAHTDLHFANCTAASHEVSKIIARFDGITELPPKEASDVVRLLQVAVTEAELVEDAYLQQVHPEYLRRFREEYTGSLRDLAEAIRAGDRVRQFSAAAAYNNFCEWVKAHAKELRFP